MQKDEEDEEGAVDSSHEPGPSAYSSHSLRLAAESSHRPPPKLCGAIRSQRPCSEVKLRLDLLVACTPLLGSRPLARGGNRKGREKQTDRQTDRQADRRQTSKQVNNKPSRDKQASKQASSKLSGCT